MRKPRQDGKVKKNNYPMSASITMNLPSDIRYVRIASNTARSVAELFSGENGGEEGKYEEFRNAFELAVTEAFSNSVRHGNSPDKGRQIFITFSPENEGLTASVADTNPAFNPEIPPPDIFSYPESGYGLLMIRQLMDEIRYSRKDGNNTLTMHKKLKNPHNQ